MVLLQIRGVVGQPRVAYLGWQPQDNAEVFRAKLDAELPAPTADEPNSKYQGGMFTADGIHEE